MLQAENFDAESPAYDYFVARQAVIHELIADALRRGQADGELHSDFDPSMVAAECLAFLLGCRYTASTGLTASSSWRPRVTSPSACAATSRSSDDPTGAVRCRPRSPDPAELLAAARPGTSGRSSS